MKNIFLLCIAWLIVFPSCLSTSHDTRLEDAIVTVVRAYHNRDSASINRMIQPETGLYIIYRRGVFPEIQKTRKIDFDHPVPGHFSYEGIKPVTKIRYEELPDYSCEKGEWNKNGLFCDTVSRDHLLSETARDLKKYRGDNIPEKRINHFRELESKSQRVVLVDEAGGELVFYLTRMDDKWYLTMIDRLTSDCSA